jgi:hypothetical protein
MVTLQDDPSHLTNKSSEHTLACSLITSLYIVQVRLNDARMIKDNVVAILI